MAATISENYTSRKFQLGQAVGRELVYDVIGTEDEDEVRDLLYATAPATDHGLLQDHLSAEPLGGGVWKGYVRYAGLDGDPEFTFSTGGGTQRITQSILTVASYAPDGMVPPDFAGAIGVTEDRVEGVDIPIAQPEFTETHRILDALVTQEYKRLLAFMHGRFNDAPFRGYAAGEVLFLGADGSKRPGDELWSITFRFAASENAEDISIGGISSGPYGGASGSLITGIDKLGWDYLWIRHADFEDPDALVLVKRPISAHVERVHHPGDFSVLGIGTD